MRMTVLSVACFFSCFGLSTSLNASSMREVFDSINAQGNVTGPAMIQGQTMNYATGGSLFLRTPVKTYNLASMTPPSWNLAGCGGIDLHLGGFSYIGKDELVQMMRNIGSNAVSYGFKLALQNICPSCDNVMQALQTTAQNINRLNIDSCEAAKGIVNAATSTMDIKQRQQSSMQFGTYANLYSDTIDAWRNVKFDSAKAKEAEEKAKEKAPNDVEEISPTGNIVWKALKQVQGIDDEYRMMLMSLTGTVIIAPAPNYNKTPILRSIQGIESILGDADKPKVKVTLLTCTDSKTADGCLKVEQKVVEMDSFNGMVQQKLDKIIQKISTRSAYTPTDSQELAAFVSSTDIPVYKIIAVGTQLGDSTLTDVLLARYGELIAAKYAQYYLEKAARDMRFALTHAERGSYNTATEDELKEINRQLDQISENLRMTMMTAYQQASHTYNISIEVTQLERTMNSHLSESVLNSLAFGNSLKR